MIILWTGLIGLKGYIYNNTVLRLIIWNQRVS